MHARFIVDWRGGCLAILFGVLMTAWPALAATDPFTVVGVSVDATADDAQAAQRIALQDGQQRALRLLFERLTMPSDHGRLPAADAGLLDLAVRGFEVGNERRAPRRYRADLTVSFNPEPVRNALRARNIPVAETGSPRILLLPVFVDQSDAQLWSELNPWAATWRRPELQQGLVDLLVPLGELNDLTIIDANQAIAGDMPALTAIRNQYRSTQALVAVARTEPASESATVDVEVVRYAANREPVLVDRVAGSPGQPLDQVLAAAAQRVRVKLEDEWKAQNMLAFDNPNELIATVGMTGLDDWLAVRRAIDSLAQVRQMEILSLAREEALIKLRYLGEPAQLSDALAQRSVALLDEDGTWALRLTGSTGAAGRTRVVPIGVRQAPRPADTPAPAPAPIDDPSGGAAAPSGTPSVPQDDDLFIE